MKTLKSIVLGLALLIVCGVAKANIYTDGENLTQDYAISTYIDAMTHGKLKGLNEVLDSDVKFSMLRGKTVLNFTRNEMLESLNASKNVEQECTTTTSVVESNEAMAVIKVDMQFQGFLRSNMVTVTNTGKGWKITNVYSIFK
ncbi:nuclear transport factor 2 family protein [Mucilaginibacter sabulilitoris]|uniref:Nuclear transport factor 2 family protein n=1 Tax=Mucilaginibacter sabulilitoris TaxID=1173583 RepID=A0ABZ0TJS4_9SPHI|nr:nuclear transport factor 2 family protein [Mucilaginibacter sabulilitoris]WPU93405.1 nuclear transport factor 2 family protein [Mucilaginibacter sabulilitoris]